MTDNTFKNQPCNNGKPVGPQGTGGSNLVGGSPKPGVVNPKGITPKVIGGGRPALVSTPVEPKVGK